MLFKWQEKKHKMSKNANEAYKLVLIHFWNLKSPDGAAVQKYQKQIYKTMISPLLTRPQGTQ